MVDKTHPLLWYLTMNGRMTDEDFAWFQAHRIKEPIIDSTGWGNLLCNTRGSIDPQGIYWLREDTLERMPSELSELHALLAQGKITSQEIPAYQFEPGPVLNGRVVGNFLKFMQGWRWIDPSPEEIKP